MGTEDWALTSIVGQRSIGTGAGIGHWLDTIWEICTKSFAMNCLQPQNAEGGVA